MDTPDQHAPLKAESSTPLTERGLGVAVVLTALVIATHWTTLTGLVERWSSDPQYSHGFVVPLFALVVLWSRRDMLKTITWKPAWIGAGVLGLGLVLRLIAAQSDIEPLDALSLLPTLFGLVLLVGGWSVLRWSWPALAFCAFMMPLPYSVEMALSHPLRRLATEIGTYSLQTLGCPALAEGNIIYVDDVPLKVEQACSGLGMLVTFFALATAMAMIVHASLTHRLILIGSAIVIAILANVVRITATGLAYHLSGRESALAQMIYHDLAGWLMMPMALAMLWVELKILENLFIEEPDEKPLAVPGIRPSATNLEMPKQMSV
jgi:exosortase